MHRPCMQNYRCVFASYGRGKYICCSKPKKPKDGSDLTTDTEESEENYGQQQATTKTPWVPPPPRPVPTPWTPQPIEASRWTTPSPWTQNNNWNNYNGNWNTGYGTWNGNWNNNVQGWIPNQVAVQPQTWSNNAGWGSYVPTNQGWTTNPTWNNQQQWNYNGYTNNVNNGAPVTQLRRRIRPPFQGIR